MNEVHAKIFGLNRREKTVALIKEHGFNPVGTAYLFPEDVFIFETEEEAEQAYLKLEKELKLTTGYWYGRQAFLDLVERQKDKSIFNVETINYYNDERKKTR